jgi:hypothetical protein
MEDLANEGEWRGVVRQSVAFSKVRLKPRALLPDKLLHFALA